MTWTEIFCLLLAGSGAGLLVIGKLQFEGKLPKDSSLGTKTWQTRASAQAWYAGNRAAAPYSYGQGAVCIAAGLIGFIFGSPGTPVAGASIGVAVIAVLVLAGFQVHRANAAAEHSDQRDTP